MVPARREAVTVRFDLILQVLGIAALSVGIGMYELAAGIIAAGVGAILFGISLERDADGPRSTPPT